MGNREQQRKVWHRLALLRHAEEVSRNVATTCRCHGISRQLFYKRRRRFYLRRHYHFGPMRISMYLKRYHDVDIGRFGVSRSSCG